MALRSFSPDRNGVTDFREFEDMLEVLKEYEQYIRMQIIEDLATPAVSTSADGFPMVTPEVIGAQVRAELSGVEEKLEEGLRDRAVHIQAMMDQAGRDLIGQLMDQAHRSREQVVQALQEEALSSKTELKSEAKSVVESALSQGMDKMYDLLEKEYVRFQDAIPPAIDSLEEPDTDINELAESHQSLTVQVKELRNSAVEQNIYRKRLNTVQSEVGALRRQMMIGGGGLLVVIVLLLGWIAFSPSNTGKTQSNNRQQQANSQTNVQQGTSTTLNGANDGQIASNNQEQATASAVAPPADALPERATEFELEPQLGMFSWIIHSYPAEKEALDHAAEFRLAGYGASVVNTDAQGRIYYRVVVGRFNSESEANNLREHQGSILPAEAWVTQIQ